MTIDSFSGHYRFLSNFWPAKVEWDNYIYPSVEHAYQAAKTLNTEERKKIQEAKDARTAKILGRRVSCREDWDEIKLEVMEILVFRKFCNNETLARRLLETWPHELVEGNHWGDTFWGICNGVGANHLGKILMKVRTGLR